MRRMTSWLTAGATTLIITLCMTVLPSWIGDGGRGKPEMPVMRPGTFDSLSNVNLVDVLAAVKLRERLKSAEWNGKVLTLELAIAPGKSRPQSLFSDIGKLTNLAFSELGNVDRLLVHVTEREADNKTLLAAVDVRRSDDWLSQELQSMAYADPVHDEEWRRRLRLSFTRAWETRFGKVAGFSAKGLSSPSPDADGQDVAN